MADLAPDSLWRAAELATFAVISLLVLLFGVRPAISRLLPPPAEGAAQTAPAATEVTTGPEAPGKPRATEVSQPSAEAASVLMQEQLTQLRQVNGQVRTSLIEEIGNVVQAQPDDALRVVRSWLHAS
jgi:flagellar M-ring protein FliF